MRGKPGRKNHKNGRAVARKNGEQTPASEGETPDRKGQPPTVSRAQLLKICEDHYLRGVSQKDIADSCGVHPTTISRWLETARREKFVHFSVCPPAHDLLRAQLVDSFPQLKHVVVQGLGPQQVAEALARFFEETVFDNATVVLDGGRTLRDFVASLKPGAQRLQIIPIAADPPSYEVSAYELMTRLSLKFPIQVQCHKPPLWPPLFPDAALADKHKIVCQAAAAADFVFLGAGPWLDSFTALEFVTHLGLSPHVLRAQYGSVAGVCGYHAFDSEGNTVLLGEVYERMRHSLPLQTLRNLTKGDCRTILVAAKSEKAQPVLAAIRAGICNHLFVDEELATVLIQMHAKGL